MLSDPSCRVDRIVPPRHNHQIESRNHFAADVSRSLSCPSHAVRQIRKRRTASHRCLRIRIYRNSQNVQLSRSVDTRSWLPWVQAVYTAHTWHKNDCQKRASPTGARCKTYDFTGTVTKVPSACCFSLPYILSALDFCPAGLGDCRAE